MTAIQTWTEHCCRQVSEVLLEPEVFKAQETFFVERNCLSSDARFFLQLFLGLHCISWIDSRILDCVNILVRGRPPVLYLNTVEKSLCVLLFGKH